MRCFVNARKSEEAMSVVIVVGFFMVIAGVGLLWFRTKYPGKLRELVNTIRGRK
jgi:uncharacterized membrane protein